MKYDYFLAAVASLAAFSDAFPAFQAELDARARLPSTDRSYRPNIPGMERSPCPGTNTLANHGFIHRNGKGITRKAYTQGFLDVSLLLPAMDPYSAVGSSGLQRRRAGRRPVTQTILFNSETSPPFISSPQFLALPSSHRLN